MKAGLAAAMLAFIAFCPAAMAQDRNAPPFAATILNLSATGEVRAPPSLAVVSLGVQAEGPSAAAAFSRAGAQMNAILVAARAQGVAPANVQTSELQLQAQYSDDSDKTPRRLTGYQASDTVDVRLHDLTRVGAVVDAMVAAGANRIAGISFQLDDPAAAENAARRKAAQALQSKAELYAQAMGYRVQRLVSLSDGSGGEERPPRPMVFMRSLGASATPVAAGELTVTATLSATYELTR